jgi:small subunit ribosomal protein S21
MRGGVNNSIIMNIIVKAGPGESSDQLIRKFKKKIQQEQILTELKEKEFYKKPSLIRKEKLTELRRKKRRNYT